MTIIDKLQNSIEQVGLPFAYGDLNDLNEMISGHDFDGGKLCYCTLISTGTAENINGQYHDQISVGVFVVDKTDFDAVSIENEQIIDECKKAVYKWLVSLRRNADLKLVQVVNSQRVYDEFDDIVTGYGVQVTLQEIEGFGACNL